MTGRRRASDDEFREVADAVQKPDLSKAVELARAHLDKGTVHPTFFNLRAYWHESNGRLDEALSDLHEARTLAPDDPIVLNAYGLCCARLGRMAEAAAAFDAACSVAPSFAQAHFNSAWANESLGELDRARGRYERVTELAPQHVDAHANLAWLLTRSAEWERARQCAERALAIAPDHPLASIALAAADLGTADLPAAEQRLRTVLGDARMQGLNRAIASGLLGDCLDGQARVAEAFAAYSSANAEFGRLYGPQVAARTSQSAFDMVRWLQRYFENAAPRTRSLELTVDPHVAAAHVFLIGFPRSGTTLLEQVLASHPDVVAMDEKEALADAAREFMADATGLDRLMSSRYSDLGAHRERYWSYVRNLGIDCSGKVFVDKLALNSLKLPLIQQLFPNAKFLVALRDPRDVVWGCFKQRFQMNAAMMEFVTPEGTARFYDATMQLLHVYLSTFRVDAHVSKYEDFVTNFETQARGICDFIGVPWNESMRNFIDRARVRAISTPSSTQVARGLYTSGIGQWRRYATHLEPALTIINPWVVRFGYSPD